MAGIENRRPSGRQKTLHRLRAGIETTRTMVVLDEHCHTGHRGVCNDGEKIQAIAHARLRPWG
jgi:hypothetical protein